jgi:glutamate N-acetyltransferase/amino-acid N-acetyltransferase
MSIHTLKAEDLQDIEGVRIAVVEAGIRYKNRLDLVVMEISGDSVVAGVFTQNAFRAAPVQVAMDHLKASSGAARYLVINTGNANAGTGKRGLEDALSTCRYVANAAGVDEHTVLPFSTGVIGENLPMDKLAAGVPHALTNFGATWFDAAKGIMTTDTRPKGRSATLELDGKKVTITGVTKGAGMIKPNMATMLSFVATDAVIPQADLQRMLAATVEQSFNRITVDGDTSTNDCCILIATGKSGVSLANKAGNLDKFEAVLRELVQDLAKDIIRDAEGGTKFVTVDIQGGKNTKECLLVAYAIAESPLVKTALSASDPNWGRILAAVGRAGIDDLDVSGVSVYLGDVCITENGTRAEGYTEEQGQTEMNKTDILITVKLARGEAREVVWTSDLSEEYVRINASYRS